MLTLVRRLRLITRRGYAPRPSLGLRFSAAPVLLRLDPHENVAPERVELSRAGALSAPQFGFDALDGVFRPESRNEFLDATPKDSHDDALLVWRGRKVAVAIDLGHPA
jgi:hypothetical protein